MLRLKLSKTELYNKLIIFLYPTNHLRNKLEQNSNYHLKNYFIPYI